MIEFLTFDQENVNSIRSCLRAARENARSVREIISSEMWEQLNEFYLRVNSAADEPEAGPIRRICCGRSRGPAICSPA